ncbi:MAG: ATP synthase F1 subunit gamma [Pirellulaceae bacterium]|nr:ATP synthase F1 subunit gamma [Pirellulaceae bacterium]
MANARALDKRRKSIRNIRKITRTMELIATARFKKAMDRAAAAQDYTDRITQIVRDLAGAGLEVSHPLLADRPDATSATMLMLTSNRGLCGGYNGAVIRAAMLRRTEITGAGSNLSFEISGKRGISAMKFRQVAIDQMYTEFEDSPKFEQVAAIADRLMEEFISGKIDRLDVVYTRFVSISKQLAVTETLLPFKQPTAAELSAQAGSDKAGGGKSGAKADYEFLPSAASILEEVVPASFRVKLFKCFLDAAVSEQIARMVAMKSATENAGDIIKQLSRTYNRARQSRITQEIMEIIGGVEALES